jgi:hypothetical protein
MSYKVKTISVFERQAKRLFKKFPSFKSELAILIQDLKDNPLLGTDLGNNCFKIRLAIASKGKGKSGGARVITHFTISDSTVYLLTIYDKSDRDNISDKELNELLAFIP